MNTYFMNAKMNGETLGVDFYDEEFGMNEMRQYKLKHQHQSIIFQSHFLIQQV